MSRHLFALFLVVSISAPTLAQQPKKKPATATATRRAAAEVLKGVKAPAGFEMTLFAQPPDVNYPACLTVTPRGEVFVGIDDQGSLGKDKDRGRIVRCVDTDGDGVADEFTDFAKVDHPRGMVWDDAARALYVMHPPDLVRYVDADGDGVAESSQTLIKSLYNPIMQRDRGADHTTNGIQIGIDGWIYIAVGDFGAFESVGADGTKLTMRGGGIVRVRTDGSGLEVYASGTRNIYDIAIDPVMNILTRDNTNDGDGWNDRLTYSPPSAYHGYPSRYKRFKDEIVDCMIDFGGGSPCGSLYLDEPGLPEGFGRTLYTVEWGQNQIDRHPLTPDGAGFKATTEKLFELPRGTDIDVDGASRLYISSWAGGGFSFTDPNVGYVIRLTPKGYAAPAFPDFRAATDEDLLKQFAAESATLRQSAQRELLRRGDKPAFAEGLVKLVTSDSPIATRSIALFTLKRLRGDAANEALVQFAQRDDLRELALRALVDRKDDTKVPAEPFVAALRDPDPRVRLIAAWGLARRSDVAPAADILPLTKDADPLVRHVSINSLVTLNAVDACLPAVAESDPALADGALRALQQIHEDRVVDGLAKRLDVVKNPALRSQIYRAICRLHAREADWDGTGWWSTRPDTSGPYYQPVTWSGTPRVDELIRTGLAKEPQEVVRSLLIDAAAHKIDLPEVTASLEKLVLTDATISAAFIDTLAGRKSLTDGQLKAMEQIVTSDTIAPSVRAKSIRMLGEELDDTPSVQTALDALAKIATTEKPDPELASALDSFITNPNQFRQMKTLQQAIANGSVGAREVALATMITISESKLTKPDPRERARKAVEKFWSDPKLLAPMLRAVGRTKVTTYADRVKSHVDDQDPAVAAAAKYAAASLASVENPLDTIVALGHDNAIAVVQKLDGDVARGKELFTKQGCVACHTVSAEDPPKGPFLGGIATRYSRAELLESILKPSAKIAQGFDTQWFKTKNDVLEGFITRESGDEVEIRNLTGEATLLKKTDIQKRGKRDTSMMPTELADKLSTKDLASLIAYLESLKP